MPKLPITVVIPVKNEEKNLPFCLAQLDEFEAVWVVDSGSEDATCAIAAEHGARVLQFAWKGGYPKKRNWVLLNQSFDTEWVLFLDADERVPSAWVDEVRGKLDGASVDGFWLNYTTHFMGGVLRHGLPQRKLALCRVGKALYEMIDDPGWSPLDMEIHEHLIVEGEVGEIGAEIDHLDYRGMTHFIARHNAYSTWEAHRHQAIVAAGPERWDKLTGRQKSKYRNLTKWWFAPSYFLYVYFVRRGFLDGRRGFDYALFKMAYFHQIRLKIIELESAS